MFGEALAVGVILEKAYGNRPGDFFREGGVIAFSLDMKTMHLFHPDPSDKLKEVVSETDLDTDFPLSVALTDDPCVDLEVSKDEVGQKLNDLFSGSAELREVVEALSISPALISFRLKGDLKAAQMFAARIMTELPFIRRGEILTSEDDEVYKFTREDLMPRLEAERFEGRPITSDDILNIKIALGQAKDSQEFIDMMFR